MLYVLMLLANMSGKMAFGRKSRLTLCTYAIAFLVNRSNVSVELILSTKCPAAQVTWKLASFLVHRLFMVLQVYLLSESGVALITFEPSQVLVNTFDMSAKVPFS
mmetsp:Transcript_10928/g.33506  ORF Transcript_10928/g.33506 Transcript_10928/m.33506 type:complete len:105 (-) Transcript_10928:992-1306(-)